MCDSTDNSDTWPTNNNASVQGCTEKKKMFILKNKGYAENVGETKKKKKVVTYQLVNVK